MKKYIFSMLCIVSIAQGMEVAQTREPREWDAQAYAQANWIQEKAALAFLEEAGINLKDKKVLDIGCGTGNISQKIAKKKEAKLVHGIDASENMIKYAQKTYPNTRNLTFEHSFAEDFVAKDRYDTAVTFFCLHYVQEQLTALNRVNHALTMNGDFFGTVISDSDPELITITAALEMVPGLQQVCSFFKDHDLIKGIGATRPTDEEVKKMLADAGFAIISYEAKAKEFIVKNRDNFETIITPLVMNLPIMQIMPYLLKQWLLPKYIDLCLTKLQQNSDGHYIFPAVYTKVFHARKIAEIQ